MVNHSYVDVQCVLITASTLLPQRKVEDEEMWSDP